MSRDLPVQGVITQSALIHPGWTPAEHYSYLVNDHFVDAAIARAAVLDRFGPTALDPQEPTWSWLEPPELPQDPTGVDCWERYEGIDQ